jgi:hypothetical protein
MTKDDEIKVREIVKNAIEKELKKEKEEIEKQIIKMIRDSEKSQKTEFLSSLKKEIDALDKKIFTKQQVKDLMINAFIKQNRFNWEKSKFLTSYFNEL